MKVSQRQITPKLATKILTSNSENNRNLRDAHVAALARDMTSGKWRENGETIIISNSGQLLDGQHRLSAIIKSKTSQKIVVVTGVPDSYITTIDQCAPRGLQDALTVAGFKNTNALGAAYRVISAYLQRGYATRSAYNKRRTAGETIEFCQQNPRISEAVTLYRHNRNVLVDKRACIVPDAVWAALHFLLDERYHEKLAQFYDRVEAGLGITRGCPSNVLRNLHIDRTPPRLPNNARLHETAAYWEKFANGQEVRKPFTNLPDHIVIFGARY